MVLPFDSDSSDPAQTIPAKGLSKEVIGELIRFKNVRVFDADTRFRYGTETALRTAALDVRSDYVLKGSISRAGNQIQITVALLQAAGHQYLWSDRFCRKISPDTMIGVRHDIALQGARVLAQPHGGIDNERARNLPRIPPESLAYRNVCFQ